MPPATLARLTPHFETLYLERQQVVFRAGESLEVVYFPISAVVSLVLQLQSGESLEVGLVGKDGVTGTAVFPGITTMTCDGVVQIPGLACRMSADTLRRELLADEALYSTIGRFAQTLLVRSMQTSVCNMFHPVEQRCVRWLLTVSDLIGENAIPVTHELLAAILGVRRPTVTLVLRSLHRAGIIREQRGRITIRDRTPALGVCCECYAVMRNEQFRLLGY